MSDDTAGQPRQYIETARVRVMLILPNDAGEVVCDIGANVCAIGTDTGKRMGAVGVYTLGREDARLFMVVHPEEARALAAAMAQAADRADVVPRVG